MSNIFLSYRFTGERLEDLSYQLGNMQDSLVSAGHEVLCSFFFEDFFKKNKFTPDQIYEYMLQRQNESQIFMPLLKSDHTSEGMLMESEQAIRLHQRYVVLTRPNIQMPQFYMHAHKIITYETFPELFTTLKTFK